MTLHLVLIGLPGSGKSTTGKLAADRLDTHWTDIDPILERATGHPITELFELEGEAAFRVREHQAVLESLELPPHVVCPGGGWAAQPGNLESVSSRVCTIHLAIEPATAARRLGDARTRPLLAGHPLERLQDLARRRLQYYRQASAEIVVDDLTSSEVADRVVAIARERAGW